MRKYDYRKLDFSGLNFPSDSLTIRTLRTVHREWFDKGFAVGGGKEQPQFFFKPALHDHAQVILGGILYIERLLAAFAFAESAGVELPPGQVSLPDLEEELSDKYVRYGLASGPKQAAELLRSVKRQGQALAGERGR